MTKKSVLLCMVLLPLYQAAWSQAFSLDTTFNLQYDFRTGISVIANVGGIKQLPGDELLVYGTFFPASYPQDYKLVKFLANGQLDPTFRLNPLFGTSGTGVWYLFDLPQGQGYLVNNGGDNIHKIDFNGNEIDLSWHDTLRAQFNTGYLTPYLFSDASMMLPCGGCFSDKYDPPRSFFFTKILPSGHIDTSFYHDTDRAVYNISKYDNNRLLVHGIYRFYDNVDCPLLCRIDTLGNRDTTWQSIFDNTPGWVVRETYVQPDGKIIVFGWFKLQNNSDTLAMVRLNPNGTLDSTFNNFNSVNGFVGVGNVVETTDGGYLIGGTFEEYQGYSVGHIVKTDYNGFIDTAYFLGPTIDSLDPVSTNLGLLLGVNHIQKSITGDAYYVMGKFLKYKHHVVESIIRIHGLTVGIDEVKTEPNIVIYPNPTSGSIKIQNRLDIGGLKVFIYDVLGNEILSRDNISNDSEVIHLEGASGVYLLKIESNDGTAYFNRVVKL